MGDKKVSVRHAAICAEYLWPEFRVVNELIFFAWAAPESINPREWHDRTEAEATLNHVHVLDIFSSGLRVEEALGINREHPDYRAACTFGKKWAAALAAKLAIDFPHHAFRVYYTQEEDPIVRFHQAHDGEPPWASEDGWTQAIVEGVMQICRVRC